MHMQLLHSIIPNASIGIQACTYARARGQEVLRKVQTQNLRANSPFQRNNRGFAKRCIKK